MVTEAAKAARTGVFSILLFKAGKSIAATNAIRSTGCLHRSPQTNYPSCVFRSSMARVLATLGVLKGLIRMVFADSCNQFQVIVGEILTYSYHLNTLGIETGFS